MRARFLDAYSSYLEHVDDKYGLDLDLRNYQEFARRDINLGDLPTAANAISVAGLALVVDGCKNLGKVSSINKIAVGRGLDLFDGSVARFMDQTSDMGAMVDVTCDKLGMAAIAKAAWQQDALPKWFISYIYAKNLTHAGLTLAAGFKHPDSSFRPPAAGKHAMMADNLAGGALLYAHAYATEFPESGHHDNLRRAGLIVAGASLIPETIALKKYIKRLR